MSCGGLTLAPNRWAEQQGRLMVREAEMLGGGGGAWDSSGLLFVSE